MSATPIRMDIYRTALPMRGFKHAAASRDVAEAIVVRVQFADGTEGWGETLPREYVTGETLDSVTADLQTVIWPMWAGRDMPAGEATAEVAGAIHEGRCMNAAICAFDLACIGRLFDKVETMGPDVLAAVGGRSRARQQIDVRVSGVISSTSGRKAARKLCLMRWLGLDDFKLKLTGDDRRDARNVQVAHRFLHRAIGHGHATLRVDVNGAWDAATAPRRIAALKPWDVCAVEQPVYCSAGELVELAPKCALPLIADESLLTEADARTLLAEPERIWWNIRMSKNGGLMGAMKLARIAADNGVTFVLGCMIGESGILSAGQRRLLQLGPGPRFVEGNYGTWLLRDDLTRPSPRFGYGGRLRTLHGRGLGVAVDPRKLARYGQLVATIQA